MGIRNSEIWLFDDVKKIQVIKSGGLVSMKGQSISETDFVVIIWTKKWTKLFFDFCPNTEVKVKCICKVYIDLEFKHFWTQIWIPTIVLQRERQVIGYFLTTGCKAKNLWSLWLCYFSMFLAYFREPMVVELKLFFSW